MYIIHQYVNQLRLERIFSRTLTDCRASYSVQLAWAQTAPESITTVNSQVLNSAGRWWEKRKIALRKPDRSLKCKLSFGWTSNTCIEIEFVNLFTIAMKLDIENMHSLPRCNMHGQCDAWVFDSGQSINAPHYPRFKYLVREMTRWPVKNTVQRF